MADEATRAAALKLLEMASAAEAVLGPPPIVAFMDACTWASQVRALAGQMFLDFLESHSWGELHKPQTVELSRRAIQSSLFEQQRSTTKVYFVTDGEFVKIGRTNGSERKRRAGYQTGNPKPLTLLAVIPNASEAALHAMFASNRVRGEWFEMCPEIDAFLTAWRLVEQAMP